MLTTLHLSRPETLSTKKSKTEEEEEVIELSSDSEDDNNENLQQPLHMPKMTTFGDNNVPKSIGGTFNQFSNPFSSQTCGSQAPSSILDQTGRGQSRGLITRYFQKVDKHKQSNLEK